MFTSKRLHIYAFAAAIMLLTGCIHNDIPYPRIQANFASIEVDHSLQPASVDSINKTVTFFLDEEADIRHVRVTSWVLSPQGAEWADSAAFAAGIDLREPVMTTLSLYQDYSWTISASQPIERYFTVASQVGASTIDVPGRRVVVYVPQNTDMKRIRVLTMKLAGTGASYSPDLTGTVTDFSTPVEVIVHEHGREETWTIYVQPSETSVNIDRVDAWTNVAWAYASAEAGKNNRFQYRQSDATEWTDVPDGWVTTDGGSFSARLIHLAPLTSYTVRALSDDDISAEVEFTTFDTYSLPNGSFDDWWLDGKIWNPWIEGGEPYWGNGNKGATTLGSSNTYPVKDTATGTGQAACLETRFVGIGVLGKLAAGNLFSGVYVRTDGTNGILHFGRPFTLHPTALHGYMKYTTAPISHASSGFEKLKGQPDTCIVWCALIDSTEPFEIRTNPANRHLFDPEASDVIAYGSVECGYNIDNYVPFTVNLKYKDTRRTPTYILIVSSASKYGDYFTGGNGAKLCIDDFSLDFDY